MPRETATILLPNSNTVSFKYVSWHYLLNYNNASDMVFVLPSGLHKRICMDKIVSIDYAQGMENNNNNSNNRARRGESCY